MWSAACAYMKHKDRREEATRCPECGLIPLKPDPRFTEIRARADNAFLASGRWKHCVCGELKTKE